MKVSQLYDPHYRMKKKIDVYFYSNVHCSMKSINISYLTW